MHNWKKDPNNIYLYEATFDIDVIDAVMNKSKKAILKQFKVLWRRLPLDPYDSFPNRLHKELLIPLQPDNTPAQLSHPPTASPIIGANKDKNLLTNSLENLETSKNPIAQSTPEEVPVEAPVTPKNNENNEKQKEKRRLASSTSWWEKAATREARSSSQNNLKRKLGYETNSGGQEGVVPVNQPVSGRTRSKTRKVDVNYSTGEPEKTRVQLKIKSNAKKTP